MKYGPQKPNDCSGDWMDHRPGVDRSRHPTTKDVRESLRLARKLLPECIEVLRDEWLRNKNKSGSERLRAIGMLMDRGLGKPVAQQATDDRQPIEQMDRADRVEVLREALEEEERALREELS